MSFLSIEFVIFFSILAVLYYFVKQEALRQGLLLIGSYVFLAFGDVRFAALLAGLSVIVWFLGGKIQKARAVGKSGKVFLWGGLFICLGLLGSFKYFDFFSHFFMGIFHREIPFMEVIVPLGISFYCLEAISYLCDIYYGKIMAVEDLWRVMLYLGFFPKIMSGPIVKAYDFIPQLASEHRITADRLSYGIQLFMVGMFKKVVIADRLGVCVDSVYAVPAICSGMSHIVTTMAYSIQIYCDFSGYSDMAIGIAHIFGYDLGKNFNMPYLSSNPSEFWRRWHISLSSWFREYVYIPLGGNRKGRVRTYINLFITMLLSGLWHGANVTFILWGALHGIVQIIHKIYLDVSKSSRKKIRRSGKVLSILFNTILVWLLWILFRSDSLQTAETILRKIFSFDKGVEYIFVYAIIYGVLIMGVHIYSMFCNKGNNPWHPLDLKKFRNKIVICVFLLVTFIFAFIGDTAFIYAQF